MNLHQYELELLRILHEADGRIGFDQVLKRMKARLFKGHPRTAGLTFNTSRFLKTLIDKELVICEGEEPAWSFYLSPKGRSQING